MLIGYVLLFITKVAMPVTDDIYPTLSQCEQAAIEYKKSHPLAVLTCGEVYE